MRKRDSFAAVGQGSAKHVPDRLSGRVCEAECQKMLIALNIGLPGDLSLASLATEISTATPGLGSGVIVGVRSVPPGYSSEDSSATIPAPTGFDGI